MNEFFSAQFMILFLLIAAASAAGAWYIKHIRETIQKFFGETNTHLDEDSVQNIMRRIARLEAKGEETDPRLAILEEIAASSIQKIGFVRFNPFPDTGGDNSFMLVMLDRDNSGVLLSSLYMREGARLYAKSIEKGRPKHTLSSDEHKLLEETLQR